MALPHAEPHAVESLESASLLLTIVRTPSKDPVIDETSEES